MFSEPRPVELEGPRAQTLALGSQVPVDQVADSEPAGVGDDALFDRGQVDLASDEKGGRAQIGSATSIENAPCSAKPMTSVR